MLYAIHIHIAHPDTGKRNHYGYLSAGDKVRSHEEIQQLPDHEQRGALTFDSWAKAYEYLQVDHFQQFARFKGNILIEPFPESGPQEIIAWEYLRSCHTYNVNFM